MAKQPSFKVVSEAGGAASAAMGGGGDGGFEARIAKLEAAVEHIQADTTDIKGEVRGLRNEVNNGLREIRTEASSSFRWLIALMGGSVVGLAGLSARGFGWL
jgi:hypothetical protein